MIESYDWLKDKNEIIIIDIGSEETKENGDITYNVLDHIKKEDIDEMSGNEILNRITKIEESNYIYTGSITPVYDKNRLIIFTQKSS